MWLPKHQLIKKYNLKRLPFFETLKFYCAFFFAFIFFLLCKKKVVCTFTFLDVFFLQGIFFTSYFFLRSKKNQNQNQKHFVKMQKKCTKWKCNRPIKKIYTILFVFFTNKIIIFKSFANNWILWQKSMFFVKKYKWKKLIFSIFNKKENFLW